MAEIACPRAGKWLRGCRWEGRYDREEPGIALEGKAAQSWSMPQSLIDALKFKSWYVRDVCATCGAVRERAAEAIESSRSLDVVEW